MTAQPKFFRCFSSLGCPALTLQQAATLAQSHDIPALELRVLENSLDLPALLGTFPGGWMGVRQFLDQHALKVQVLGTSCKLIGGGDNPLRSLSTFAPLAEALGTPYLRVFGGGAWGDHLAAADYAAAGKLIEQWQALRRENGWEVDLLVETHDAFSASAPCLNLLEHAAVEFIWDSHHTWRLGGETPAESWAALHAHVRHVHVKDSIDRPSARHPFTYVLPGQGEMPLDEVTALLETGGYRGAVSLEWEKQWHPYLPALEEALAAWQAKATILL